MTTQEQPSELELTLWSLQALVERLGAELKDPATPSARKQELIRELRGIQRIAIDLKARAEG